MFTNEGSVAKARRLANLERDWSLPHSWELQVSVIPAGYAWPSDVNSHPHTDESQKFSVVHNGIVENYLELKEELISQGHHFVSETDTEVISHLIAREYDGDIVKAVQKAISYMRGAFALGVLTEYEPDRLVAVRQASPLLLVLEKGEPSVLIFRLF